MKTSSEERKIGARLKAMRIKRGVRQNFVAAKIGITNNYLSELEHGKKRWFAFMVAAYEKALN